MTNLRSRQKYKIHQFNKFLKFFCLLTNFLSFSASLFHQNSVKFGLHFTRYPTNFTVKYSLAFGSYIWPFITCLVILRVQNQGVKGKLILDFWEMCLGSPMGRLRGIVLVISCDPQSPNLPYSNRGWVWRQWWSLLTIGRDLALGNPGNIWTSPHSTLLHCTIL